MRELTAPRESALLALWAALLVRVAAERARFFMGYLAIFAAALSGFSGIGVWAIAAAAIALASSSHAEYSALYRRGRQLGLTQVVQSAVLQSFVNALMAAGAAYGVGVFVRWL